MKKTPMIWLFVITLSSVYLFSDTNAEARMGSRKSFGSRGTRGAYSRPQRPPTNSQPSSPHYQTQKTAPAPQTQPTNSQQNFRPGFWSSMGTSLAAGIAGGLIGNYLFRLFGGNSHFLGAGSGIGFLEILLLAGLLFVIVRYFLKKSKSVQSNYHNETQDEIGGAESLLRNSRGHLSGDFTNESHEHKEPDLSEGFFSSSGRVTPLPNNSPQPTSLEANGSIETDQAIDLFFQIQRAWSDRDLTPIEQYLTPEVKIFLESEISDLKLSRQVNRIENIAIRKVELVDSWNEAASVYSTVKFQARLLDYIMNEETSEIMEGSKTDPVRFEEFWTFAKPNNASTWKLSAVQQIPLDQ